MLNELILCFDWSFHFTLLYRIRKNVITSSLHATTHLENKQKTQFKKIFLNIIIISVHNFKHLPFLQNNRVLCVFLNCRKLRYDRNKDINDSFTVVTLPKSEF